MNLKLHRRAFIAAMAGAGSILLDTSAWSAKPFSPTRFSVEVRGSGPDVILIPGLASSRAVWKGTVAAVPDYRYHLVQLAGFAGEPVRGNAQGPIITGVAEELSRYIVATGLVRPAIVGHSMGGSIAMLLAIRHPGAVGRLMVVDMLPQPSGLVGSSPERVHALADSLRHIAEAPGGRELIASMMGLFGAPSDPRIVSDPDVVARALHELATLDLSRVIGGINAPMLVVYPSARPQQRALMDRVYAAGYRAARGARRLRIDDSGHVVMADQPVRFRSALRDFLAGLN